MSEPFVDKTLAVLGQIGANATNLHLLCSHRDQIVPFVGAGLFIEFGYPSWSRFLEICAERFGLGSAVKSHLAAGQFEEAAETLAERYPNAFDDYLRERFAEENLHRPVTGGAVCYLPQIVRGPVLTTNFDHVLETAFEDAGRRFGRVFPGSHIREASRAIQLNQPFLLKLHGDYDEADSRVLTLGEYAREYGGRAPGCIDFDLPLPRILAQALAARPLLFLGCSLRSDRTTLLIADIAKKYEGTIHFALLPATECVEDRSAQLDRWNIRPIFFPAGEFAKIGQFLTLLAETVPPEKVSSTSLYMRRDDANTVAIQQATQALDEYSSRLQRPNIPPLLVPQKMELVGHNVIDQLRGTTDVLLLGRSGLGKSFHLEHYRRMCLQFDEVPILLDVRYYCGDLTKAIQDSIGSYTRLTAAQLFDAAEQLNKRPVLIVDGWNPDADQSDLANQIGALQLRHEARLIIAAQTPPTHELFARVSKVELAPLGQVHKEAIFSYHAGKQSAGIPPHFYQQFSTAFDLTVAGRCQLKDVGTTCTELYGAYVRSVLPSTAARALLRNIAWYMGENFKPALAVQEYEYLIENLTQKLGLPLALADELLKCRLVAANQGLVSFEHDLLREYFRAEYLVRDYAPESIAARLQEPRYAPLAEFVISCLDDENVARAVLFAAGSNVLNASFRGWLGLTARTVVRGECQRVLTDCRDRLSEIIVEPFVGKRDDGRVFVSSAFVASARCASDLDRTFCVIVADNIDDDSVYPVFLELLDAGEKALKKASERAGRENRIKPIAIWRELLHHNVILGHPGQSHTLLFLCHLLRQNRSLRLRHSSEPGPVHKALLKNLTEEVTGDLVLLLLMSDLRHSAKVDLLNVLAIARKAWDTGLPTLRMEALDFVHSNAHAICQAGQGAEDSVVALLESFDVKDNILLSTQWLDTRAAFSGFDIGIDIDNATEEFRRILAVAEAGDDLLFQLERQSEPNISFTQFLAGWASSALGKMFDDVFQGVYYDAFFSLRDDEKKKILVLGLEETQIGLFTDWYLEQLRKIGCEGAENILSRFGGRIDPESFCPQDSVKCFLMAHEMWARVGDKPIPYEDASSLDHEAWATIGELTFWLNRNKAECECADRISTLSDDLMHYCAALPDVLRQAAHCDVGRPAPALNLLLTRCPRAIRIVLHRSLSHRADLTSVFSNSGRDLTESFRWCFWILGDIGDRTSITHIRPWTASSVYGKDAIRAIEQIELRETRPYGYAVGANTPQK